MLYASESIIPLLPQNVSHNSKNPQHVNEFVKVSKKSFGKDFIIRENMVKYSQMGEKVFYQKNFFECLIPDKFCHETMRMFLVDL